MRVKQLAWSLLAVLAVVVPGVRADSWAPPSPRVYANKWGSHGFKVLPVKDAFGKPATGILFTLDPDGKERVVWEKQLVNQPYRAFLANVGGQVVTVDTYASLGYKHCLVVYDKNGKSLADHALEDLIPKEEIAAKVLQTASSRHWASGATFSFSDDGEHFVVKLKWDRTIKVDLATGKVVKP